MIGDLWLKDRLSRYRLSTWALVVAGSLIVVAACGKRGPPLPPLRPAPSAVTDLTIVRRGDDITIHFLKPTTNLEGSEPLVFDRVEIYGMTVGAGGFPPTAAQLLQRANLLAVLGKTNPDDAKGKNDARITFVDKGIVVPPPVLPVAPKVAAPEPIVAPDRPATAPSAAIRYYLFLPFANRRRAGAGTSLGVPLVDPPARPQGAELSYDEQSLTLKWTLTPGDSYLVYPSGPDVPADVPAVTPVPLTVATFTQPVVFGKPVCFVVRSTLGAPTAATESAASDPACATPVDTFPPPAPANLVALAAPGAISLTWDAVAAADLAGYIVLRGEGSGDRLQPLMAEPVTGTSFKDGSAKAGVRYFYAVVAVDKATPPNRSKNSNVVEETGR